MKIRIGTRGSALALWQAEHVASLLGKENCEIIIIKTQGDRIQNVSFDKMEGKGFFTKEIEEALLKNEIDVAVHSLKDLPTDDHEALALSAILERESPSDLLLIRKENVDRSRKLEIRENAVVGTSSVRRLAQLRNADPTLVIKALRGNVTTRVRKLADGEFDAIVLAEAGLKRLEIDLREFHIKRLEYDYFLPAPAQGAIAVQTRKSDKETIAAVKKINHAVTEKRVRAERAFLKAFGGGCHIPLGALAEIDKEDITLEGVISSADGTKTIREKITGSEPIETGSRLADIIKERGGDRL